MKGWLLPAFLAVFFWGFWGFFPKLAVRYIDPRSALVFQSIGAILLGVVVLVAMRFQVQWQPAGVLFATLTGFAGFAGSLFFLIAVSRVKISIVVALTALYPVLSITLAILLLRESISLKQFFGAVLAVAAAFLLTT